tara:strand:- start:253 stop:777 length:525 start_codon:yes stop_codon:yes gene_type:complete
MKTVYKGDPRYEALYEKMQLLGIQDVSTSRQVKNGTIEWLLPVKDQYGGEIHVASFASGYVRRTKAGGYCPSWQLNKRVESEPQRYGPFEDGTYREFTTRTCKLIPNEIERLDYLIAFCLKNYYVGQANKLSSGEFIPKWKHEYEIKETKKLHVWQEEPEVKVIINGHRYNITP